MKFCNIKKVVILCSLLVMPSVFPWLDYIDIDTCSPILIKTLKMRFCYISFVNIDGTEYIVKQKKSDCLRKLLGVVRDTLMAHLAEGFIPAHRVGLIRAGKKFIGKKYDNWPATIHTIAPGKMLKAQNSPYNGMNLKQRDTGFVREMLSWMLEDDVLMRLVAFDLVFCNHDRHRGNLFYDLKTDKFCAIDMDSSFKYNLCAFACKNFEKMLASKHFYLKSKEIKALVALKGYLQFLIDNYKPKNTIQLYEDFAVKAGFVEGSDIYIPKFVDEMIDNKRMIARSYEDAQKFVQLLEIAITRARKRREVLAAIRKN